MTFEVETIHKSIDVTEDDIWSVISSYFDEAMHGGLSVSSVSSKRSPDLRCMRKWSSDYVGIPLDIHFYGDNDKQMWLGVTYLGREKPVDVEHLIGYVEVRPLRISARIPSEVRVVCTWEPFFVFFQGMANAIITRFCTQPIDNAMQELIDFKTFTERQLHSDYFVDSRPQESYARGFLQAFLGKHSYREVPVRGGKSDILIFHEQGRFLYETKIWRGRQHYQNGLEEIHEYIVGEESDEPLSAVFYVRRP